MANVDKEQLSQEDLASIQDTVNIASEKIKELRSRGTPEDTKKADKLSEYISNKYLASLRESTDIPVEAIGGPIEKILSYPTGIATTLGLGAAQISPPGVLYTALTGKKILNKNDLKRALLGEAPTFSEKYAEHGGKVVTIPHDFPIEKLKGTRINPAMFADIAASFSMPMIASQIRGSELPATALKDPEAILERAAKYASSSLKEEAGRPKTFLEKASNIGKQASISAIDIPSSITSKLGKTLKKIPYSEADEQAIVSGMGKIAPSEVVEMQNPKILGGAQNLFAKIRDRIDNYDLQRKNIVSSKKIPEVRSSDVRKEIGNAFKDINSIYGNKYGEENVILPILPIIERSIGTKKKLSLEEVNKLRQDLNSIGFKDIKKELPEGLGKAQVNAHKIVGSKLNDFIKTNIPDEVSRAKFSILGTEEGALISAAKNIMPEGSFSKTGISFDPMYGRFRWLGKLSNIPESVLTYTGQGLETGGKFITPVIQFQKIQSSPQFYSVPPNPWDLMSQKIEENK